MRNPICIRKCSNCGKEIDGEKYLRPEYVVHHIDGNRRNNEVSNLVVMTRNEHTQLHMNLRKNSK